MEFIGNKEQGLFAELQFMVDAYAYGIVCARPQIEQKFDLYAEGIRGVKKVQVKCTKSLTECDNYKFSLGHGRGSKEKYKENEIDVIALYAMPIKTWWIFPFDNIPKTKTLTLNLHFKNFKKNINGFELI